MQMRWMAAAISAGVVMVGGVALPQSAQASDPTIFKDFESDAELAGITVTLPEEDEVSRAPFGTHGDSSLRFSVGPPVSPTTKLSALTLRKDSGSLPATDWSGHVAVGFDFFTDIDYDVIGRVTITDTANRSWGANYTIRARDWTPFNVRISTLTNAGLNAGSIASFAISIPRAAHPVTGFYDAFRLVDEFPYDQTEYGDRAAAALLGLHDFRGILDRLEQRLSVLERQVPGHDAVAQRLSGRVGELQDAVTGLQSDLEGGPMTYSAYSAFNAAVIDAERGVPRLANLIRARIDAPHSDFGVQSADSMSLVYPKDLPFDSTGPSPTVRMTQGEHESLQAVVLPYVEDLGGVRAEVVSVRGPRGEQVPASDLRATVDPVGSLDTVPSNIYRRGVYTGWTPDPIRDDISTLDIAATDVQPYWVRFESGQDARPGTYTVRLRFSADGKHSHDMDVTVGVWPFRIPEQPALPTAFQYTPDITAMTYGVTDPAEKETLKHEFWSFLNDYKIKPDQIYTVDGDPAIPDGFTIRPTPVEDVLYIKEHYGLTHFNALYLWAGALDRNDPDSWQAQIDEWLAQLETAMEEYREAGVAEYAYVYGFDESTGPLLQAAKQTFAAVKERFPDVPIMTTLRDNSMGVDTGLTELVDIWAPQQDLYDYGVAERTRARGDQAWWYPDIATGHPLPNWFNGYPAIDARMLMGPMSYQAGVEGVLYYATNHWTFSQHQDHPLVDDGIFSGYDPRTFGATAGDGSLFYPGPEGPMASIRLENFRDGMEDYNLLVTLRAELDRHPDAPGGLREQAQRLLSARDVVTDSRRFTEDPVTYRHWRDRVASVTSRLMS